MNPDAVVIGGGLAGAATAVLLAEKGRHVVLLEKETAVGHKVCGEFISWEAVHYLQRLGINLPALGAQSIGSLHLEIGGQSMRAALPFQASSLSRLRLDQAVLAIARAKGADIRQGDAVTTLTQQEGGWRVETATGSVHTPVVFLASGKTDVRGWQRPHTRKSDLIGFKMHFHLQPDQVEALRQHIEMLLFDGGYAGLELVEDDIANLCLLIHRKKYQACQKNWISLLEMIQDASPLLQQRLNGALPRWQRPLAIYGMPYGYIYRARDGMEGLYRLGDQMSVISSFAGDGMAMALHSAFIATACYLNGKTADDYHDRAYLDFRKPVKTADFISTFALIKNTHPWLCLVCSMWPGSLNWAAQAVRFNSSNTISFLK